MEDLGNKNEIVSDMIYQFKGYSNYYSIVKDL